MSATRKRRSQTKEPWKAIFVVGTLLASLFLWSECSFKKHTVDHLDGPSAVDSDLFKNSQKYAIKKNTWVFSNRETIAEFFTTPKEAQNLPEAEQDKIFLQRRLQRERQGLRFDLPRDCIVHVLKEDKTLGDSAVCEVLSEESQGLKTARFWVLKSFLLDQNDIEGSKILTGFSILRGNEQLGVMVGNLEIQKLPDLIAALYEGEISEDEAKKIVFMPGAQSGELATTLEDDYVYEAHHPYRQTLIAFAMKRNEAAEPLFSGPIRYVGRREFLTKGGLVKMLPIMALEKGVED